MRDAAYGALGGHKASLRGWDRNTYIRQALEDRDRSTYTRQVLEDGDRSTYKASLRG